MRPPASHATARTSALTWCALSLAALGACAPSPPTPEAHALGAGNEKLRFREEHLIGAGAAGIRQLSEPNGQHVLCGIQQRTGKYVDALRFRYCDPITRAGVWAPWVGGFGGTEQAAFFLEASESLVRVDARAGLNIDALAFTTVGHPSGNRVYGPFGPGSGSQFTFQTGFGADAERRQIHGFVAGSAGTPDLALNWIKFIDYLPGQTRGAPEGHELHVGWGGNGGSEFSFLPQPHEEVGGVVLALAQNGELLAFATLFRSTINGAIRETGWAGNPHAPNSGTVTIGLSQGESFIGAYGSTGDNVYALAFVTSQGRVVGPFGFGIQGRPFQFETRIHGGLRRKITGFKGRAGQRIDRLEIQDTYPACGHFACQQGAPMAASCDPCVAAICAQNPSCCSSSWNATCVQQVTSICRLTCNPA